MRLNKSEYKYLQQVMRFSEKIRELILRFNISDQEVADIFCIDIKKVEAYKTGAINYDLQDMARLNAAHISYLQAKNFEEAQASVPVKVPGDE